MSEIANKIDLILNSAVTSIHVFGESGTGKEIVAKILNSKIPKSTPFISVDAGAISDMLGESLLFGHKKGAFSGAVDNSKGYIAEADGGWLFLDEIANLSKNLQPKLLRVLESKEYIRVGDSKPQKANFKLITASNRSLKKMVENGEFMLDLWQRIQESTIELQPLRERDKVEIEKLIEFFCQNLSNGPYIINEDAKKVLMECSWEFGNIRALRNAIVHMTMAPGHNKVLTPQGIPKSIYEQLKGQGEEFDLTKDDGLKLTLDSIDTTYQEACDHIFMHLVRKNSGYGGPRSLRFYADRLKMNRSTISARISALERKGLLNRQEFSKYISIRGW